MKRAIHISRPLLAIGLAVAALTSLPRSAHAEGSVKLEDHEAKGYFDKFARFGAFVGMVNGTSGSVAPNGVVPPSTGYKRTGFGVDFDLLGFWDATRFDTLIGAEMLVKFGSYTGPKLEGGADASRSYLFFRMDSAATYGLLHWDGAIKGRVSGGAGFGFDLDGGRWYTESGRAYPLLLGRVQLQVGDVGLHASYHWVPTTTNNLLVREHRLEGSAGFGALHGGLRYTITTARADTVPDAAMQREAGVFVAYAF